MSQLAEAQEPSAKYLVRSRSSLDRGFDLLATAPNGLGALRELVLAVALRGRLDDPKRVLVSSGVTESRQKATLLRRFALPPGWKWRTVGELCTLRTGATPSTSRREYYGGHIKWLVSGDIHSQEIYDCKGRITELAMANANCKLLPPDSVMIALNGQGKTRATVAILRAPAACNQSLVAMTPLPDSGITPEFLFWNLRYRYREIRDITGQKQRRGLNMGLVSALSIVVPPVEEQMRIVARVDELMRLCDVLEAKGRLEAEQHARLLGTLLGPLTESTGLADLAESWERVSENFDLMFDRPEAICALEETILELAVKGLLVPLESDGKARIALPARLNVHRSDTEADRSKKVTSTACPPYELPETWAWAPLGDLVENMGSGWSPACDAGPRMDSRQWAVLRTTAVQRMEYRPGEHKVLPSKLYPRPDIEVQRGDVLITRAGPMNRVGVCCLVEDTPAKLMLSDKIVRFRPVADLMNPAFLVLALNAGWTKACLDAARTGMAASQVNVSQSDLKGLPVPVCGKTEQARIVARVTELRHLCANLRERLAASQETQYHLAEALVESALTTHNLG